jgi:hypothetical protein
MLHTNLSLAFGGISDDSDEETEDLPTYKDILTDAVSCVGRSTHSDSQQTQTLFGEKRRDLLVLLPENEDDISDSDFESTKAVESKVRTLCRGKKQKISSGTGSSRAKKKTKQLQEVEIAAALRPCCPKNCWQKFSFEQVSKVRHYFWEKNRNDQVDWITRNLLLWGHLDQETSLFKFRYQVDDTECCASFFEQALPVSHGRLWTIRKRVLTNTIEDFEASQSTKSAPKRDRVSQFLNSYETEHGNGMPNDRTVQLPMGSTKQDVYLALKESLAQSSSSSGEAISKSTFYKAWKEQKPDLKCARWHRFSKCSTCSNIKTLQSFYKAGQISGKGLTVKSCRHDFLKSCGHDFR